MYFGSSFEVLGAHAFVLILYLLHDYYFEKLFDLFTRLEVDSDIILRFLRYMLAFLFMSFPYKDSPNGPIGEIQSPQPLNNWETNQHPNALSMRERRTVNVERHYDRE
jgi:hypothetical protein